MIKNSFYFFYIIVEINIVKGLLDIVFDNFMLVG